MFVRCRPCNLLILLDIFYSEPSGTRGVLNSGIWPSCLTFPAVWTCPVSLIVLIVYDHSNQKSTPNVNFFDYFWPVDNSVIL